MKGNSAIYGLLADFDTPEALLAAARQAREEGYARMDAYTPFPVEGLGAALGLRPNRVPLLVLLGGCAGALGGYLMQYYAAAVAYPLNVGGRPLHSWPAFIPITFELTVLTASLVGLVGMLLLNHLPLPYHPVFHVPHFQRATRDRFFLCIEVADPKFDLDATRSFLRSLGAEQVVEVPD